MTSSGKRPVGVTFSAFAYLVSAALLVIVGGIGSIRELARPERALGSAVLVTLITVTISLVGIGLLHRRRVAFVAALGMAALLALPIPPPEEGQVALYVVQEGVAIVVLILLVRNRAWFARRKAPSSHPTDPR